MKYISHSILNYVYAIPFLFIWTTNGAATDLDYAEPPADRYELNVKLGYDFSGNLKKSQTQVNVPSYPVYTYTTITTPETNSRVTEGTSLSIEGLGYPINEHLGVGFGLTYQLPRTCDGNFNFLPLYYTMKLRTTIKQVHPYLLGQLGYNLVFPDSTFKPDTSFMSGGLYTAFGGGISYKNWFFEILATQHHASVTDSGYTSMLIDNGTNRYVYTYYPTQRDITYSKITANVGMRFF